MFGFAEEVGFVGRQQVYHGLDFFRKVAASEHSVVVAKTAQFVLREPPAQAADEQDFLGVGESDPGNLVDQPLEQAEFLVGDGRFDH